MSTAEEPHPHIIRLKKAAGLCLMALLGLWFAAQVWFPVAFWFSDSTDDRYAWRMFASHNECSVQVTFTRSGGEKVTKTIVEQKKAGEYFIRQYIEAGCSYKKTYAAELKSFYCDPPPSYLVEMQQKKNLCKELN